MIIKPIFVQQIKVQTATRACAVIKRNLILVTFTFLRKLPTTSRVVLDTAMVDAYSVLALFD